MAALVEGDPLEAGVLPRLVGPLLDGPRLEGMLTVITEEQLVAGPLRVEQLLGQVIPLVVMVVGIAFVALLTGAVAERFLEPEIKEEVGGVEVEAERRSVGSKWRPSKRPPSTSSTSSPSFARSASGSIA